MMGLNYAELKKNEGLRTMTMYIGNGCFSRMSDCTTMFVKKENRPSWLEEFSLYILRSDKIPGGVVNYVEEQVPNGHHHR